MIGISFYANVLKKNRKRTKIDHSQNFVKTNILSNKQYISYDIISFDTVIFELEEVGWDLSMTRISYKLTKRTAETEKKNFGRMTT